MHQSAQGRGIAAEAVEAVATFGFNQLGLRRLEIIAMSITKPVAELQRK
ncbi:GNAT family N-acetyltransferase [uncultured Tolumonas sp.]|nr:GNAT family N-acetyltransferase [uncultured Tolumonas sp.]